MNNFLYVFLGSGLGGCLRYGLMLGLRKYNFILPIHTLFANVIACLFLGLTMGYLMQHTQNSSLKFILAIGICGGLSTYSSFSYEVIQQMESGDWLNVFIYSLGTFILCLLCILLGLWIVKTGFKF